MRAIFSSDACSPDRLWLDPASTYFPSSPGAVSPVPLASSETLLKYGGDAKLFPFPGIFPGVKRLEEERRTRVGGLSLNASSPDIVSPPTVDEFSAISSGSASSRTPQASPEFSRDRKLSQQASDTRLFQKFNSGNIPPALSSPSTSTTQPDSASLPTPNNSGWLGGKLPTNREGVKKWLITKGLFPSQSSQSLQPSVQQPILGPTVTPPLGSTDLSRKPSLSDLFDPRRDGELVSDMSRTPTTNENAPQSRASQDDHEVEGRESSPEGSSTPETPAHDKLPYDTPHGLASNGDAQSETYPAQSMSPAPDPNSSATPDPTSSLDDYASQSSPSSSSPERFLEPPTSRTPGTMILERLDEMLGPVSRGSDGSPFVDDPPRKLLLSSQVFQVANSNTVKDRFLFLFNDILVIAKPVTYDYDALLDMSKPSPLDRKFIVKSVAQLRDVRFTADRDDLPLSSFASISRNPLVRTFVVQFSKDADHAIVQFFEKSGTRDDPTVLGQLLFRMLDLDRAKLGDYLSRRTSKVVLKAFIGSFGFGGVRIDRALRVFLQSLHLSPSRYSNPLEYVSDSFASRWYDANTDLVAYDKDLAIRLVRAVIQLNGVLYGGVIQDPLDQVQVKRNVTSRDFIDAFRRYDPRCLVSDELLDRIHASIRREPLSQARNSALSTTPDQLIVLKRPIPSRLTYRMQSEPIIVRVPQVDPSLTIHLHGNELIFDPPYLSFTRSAEASFRITGTGLGLKTVSFSRSGPSALLYTGLPLSSPIVIERSFMRNTFQLAFVNHEGSKRRYMFSVDDPVMRYNWTVSLKRQIDIACAGQQAQTVGPSPFHRAAEQIAFRVLQETLIPPLSVDRGHTSFASQYFSAQALVQPLSPRRSNRPDASGTETPLSSHHVRSKSRSQVYHRQGPGKLEHQQLDLLLSPNSGDSTDSPETDTEDASPPEGGSRLWGGKELEMICQQNSAIVLVLASSQTEPVHRSTLSPAPLRPAISVQ
jgi:serine/arginine repetitive matrix protein 2